MQIGLRDPDNLPVAGVAEARKMADKTLPSNALMPNWAKSDGKPIQLAWLREQREARATVALDAPGLG